MICLIFIERTYFLDKKFVYSIHIIEGAAPNTHRNLEGNHWKFCMSDYCTIVVRHKFIVILEHALSPELNH